MNSTHPEHDVCANSGCRDCCAAHNDPHADALLLYRVLLKDREVFHKFMPRLFAKVTAIVAVGADRLNADHLQHQLRHKLGLLEQVHLRSKSHGESCVAELARFYRFLETVCAPQHRQQLERLSNDHFYRRSTTTEFVEHTAALIDRPRMTDQVMWNMDLIRSAVYQRHEEVLGVASMISMIHGVLQPT